MVATGGAVLDSKSGGTQTDKFVRMNLEFESERLRPIKYRLGIFQREIASITEDIGKGKATMFGHHPRCRRKHIFDHTLNVSTALHLGGHRMCWHKCRHYLYRLTLRQLEYSRQHSKFAFKIETIPGLHLTTSGAGGEHFGQARLPKSNQAILAGLS